MGMSSEVCGKEMNCTECNERPIGYNDYLCRTCRGIADGKDICDHCHEVYNKHWNSYGWKDHHGAAPRFAGLCLTCKDIAARAIPFNPEPPKRAIDEWVSYCYDLRKSRRTDDWCGLTEPKYSSWQA